MSKTVEIDSGYQEDHEFFILQIIISWLLGIQNVIVNVMTREHIWW